MIPRTAIPNRLLAFDGPLPSRRNIVVTGRSGCGKSTFMASLFRGMDSAVPWGFVGYRETAAAMQKITGRQFSTSCTRFVEDAAGGWPLIAPAIRMLGQAGDAPFRVLVVDEVRGEPPTAREFAAIMDLAKQSDVILAIVTQSIATSLLPTYVSETCMLHAVGQLCSPTEIELVQGLISAAERYFTSGANDGEDKTTLLPSLGPGEFLVIVKDPAIGGDHNQSVFFGQCR